MSSPSAPFLASSAGKNRRNSATALRLARSCAAWLGEGLIGTTAAMASRSARISAASFRNRIASSFDRMDSHASTNTQSSSASAVGTGTSDGSERSISGRLSSGTELSHKRYFGKVRGAMVERLVNKIGFGGLNRAAHVLGIARTQRRLFALKAVQERMW